MKEPFQIVQVFIGVSPMEMYEAWLDSSKHSAMTGGEALCSNQEGDTFTTWDGYISGRNIKLSPNFEIVQAWRTTEFEENDEDSMLLISFDQIDGGTQLTLHHSNIPQGQTQYKKGWEEHYLTPMKLFFNRK